LDDQALADELVNSKLALEANLSKEVRFIAYSYGDANSAVKHAAWEAGYVAGIGAFGGVEPDSLNKWYLSRVAIDAPVSVNYDPSSPGSFFMTRLGDPDVVIPEIRINSVDYLDAETNQPLANGSIVAGQSVKVHVTASKTGPAVDVVASLALAHTITYYDSHTADPPEDVTVQFASGQQVFEWTWLVPPDAAKGQYYAQVTFHDVPYVLGWLDSGSMTAFQVE
jgi:hypothetical protein